jgi:hypothetical protein
LQAGLACRQSRNGGRWEQELKSPPRWVGQMHAFRQ